MKEHRRGTRRGRPTSRNQRPSRQELEAMLRQSQYSITMELEATDEASSTVTPRSDDAKIAMSKLDAAIATVNTDGSDIGWRAEVVSHRDTDGPQILVYQSRHTSTAMPLFAAVSVSWHLLCNADPDELVRALFDVTMLCHERAIEDAVRSASLTRSTLREKNGLDQTENHLSLVADDDYDDELDLAELDLEEFDDGL